MKPPVSQRTNLGNYTLESEICTRGIWTYVQNNFHIQNIVVLHEKGGFQKLIFFPFLTKIGKCIKIRTNPATEDQLI